MEQSNENNHRNKIMSWLRGQTIKSVRFNLLSFEAKKFLLFLAVPIGVFILFKDTERVASMNRFVCNPLNGMI